MREEINLLKENLSDLRARLNDSLESNQRLKSDNEKLLKQKIQLQESSQALEEKHSFLIGISGEASKYKLKCSLTEKRCAVLEKKANTLSEELLDLRDFRSFLVHSDDQVRDFSSFSCQCSLSSMQKIEELEGKNILLVGGRQSMVPHCRAFVEQMKGSFTHHDGGREQSKLSLSSQAMAADIIVCALDCVSHDASQCVKRVCKKGNQRIIMLKNSGLSTFSRELSRVV